MITFLTPPNIHAISLNGGNLSHRWEYPHAFIDHLDVAMSSNAHILQHSHHQHPRFQTDATRCGHLWAFLHKARGNFLRPRSTSTAVNESECKHRAYALVDLPRETRPRFHRCSAADAYCTRRHAYSAENQKNGVILRSEDLSSSLLKTIWASCNAEAFVKLRRQ